MAPLRKSERLARELAHDPAVGLRQAHESPHVLRRLCNLADQKMTSGDRDCLRVARLCCRIAGRLKTAEARVLSFARLASALRLAGRLGHSDRALEVAFTAAPDHLRGDLLRRRCCRLIYQHRFAEALPDAEAAVEQTSGTDHARALGALGVVLGYSGKRRGAIRAHGQCLAATDPDAELEYCNAVINYATSLSGGTKEEAREALELCAEARSNLKRRHKMQRAKLRWTEGLLHLGLGENEQAWPALNTARRSLIALRAVPEVAAIIADMAAVDPEPMAVRHICYEAAMVITAPHVLAEPLEALAHAAPEAIPQAAAELRDAASRLAAMPAL